jgi:hypothetical protein
MRLASPAFRGTVALAAVALACLFGLATTARAQLPVLQTGVSYVYDSDPLAFEHVKAAGATLVQTPLRWANVAPAKPPASWNPADPADPNYDWSGIDEWVRNAVGAGLTPLLQVRGAPLWAQRCQGTTEAPCDIDPAALRAFAEAAVSRYSGKFAGLPRVRYWQALNEPNLSLFFAPQYVNGRTVSPYVYRRLLNSFYAGAKAADPSSLVLAAGLGPYTVPGYTIGPMAFTRKLLCMQGREHPHPTNSKCEGGVHFDIYDIHPYTAGAPSHKGPQLDDVELGDLAKLTGLLAAADRAGRIKGAYRHTPLWITELSWDSNPPDPGGLAMPILDQWTAEALYRASKAGIRRFFWFSLSDPNKKPDEPWQWTTQSGLYFWAGNVARQQPKENLQAFRFPFVAFARRGGLYVWGRDGASAGGRVHIEAVKNGSWRVIRVLRADSNGLFEATLPIHYGRNKRGAVRARYFGERSLPFPMNRVGDFPQQPFWNPVPE